MRNSIGVENEKVLLKYSISNAPILANPDSNLPFTVVTDSSGFAIGAALCQGNGDVSRPIAFMSKKLLPAEMNYPTHERELLAIICALKEWRHYLFGNHFTILTDHRPLQYLNTQPHLSARQTQWREFLQQFDFTIGYQQGESNKEADALSRRSDHQDGSPKEANMRISEIKVDSLIHKIEESYVYDVKCVRLLKGENERKTELTLEIMVCYIREANYLFQTTNLPIVLYYRNYTMCLLVGTLEQRNQLN